MNDRAQEPQDYAPEIEAEAILVQELWRVRVEALVEIIERFKALSARMA